MTSVPAQAPATGPLRRALAALAPPLVPAVLVAAVWQWYAVTTHSFVFPTFSSVVAALGSLVGSADFWQAMVATNQSLVIGYLAAVVLGVPLGIVIGRAVMLRNVVDPYINITLVTPLAVLMPIILMALGLTLTARSFVVFVFALPFVVIPTLSGVRVLDARWIEMAQCFGASRLQTWREVLLPGALPSILSGLRQGFAHAITGMVVVELTLMAVGVGVLLETFGAHLRYDFVFAVIMALIVEAVLGVSALNALERRVGRAW